MGLYDIIKDGITLAQKANNLPLVTALFEAQKQALDLLHENEELKRENDKLKAGKNISDRIVRHKDAYITLKDDEQEIIYCSNCYDKDKLLIQTQTLDNGKYYCPACEYNGYYDMKKHEQLSKLDSSNSFVIL